VTSLNEYLFPRGTLSRDGWESIVDDTVPGSKHTQLQVREMHGESVDLSSGAIERLVVPLAGAFRIRHSGGEVNLEGRETVFEGPTDVFFSGADEALAISGTGRIAVAAAPTNTRKPSRHIGKSEVPVELRGTGSSTRQVHNFGTPETLDTTALIVCEVITPAGNWSSYPGHKHDEAIPGVETELEEIYYFEAAVTRGVDGPEHTDPFGSFSTYSSSAGEIETRALVKTGDIAMVPYGYHGPAAAAPDYDLYYLNVMAGPGPERAWRFTDDPRQTWVRTRWKGLSSDPRLPYRSPNQGGTAR
jgi:5-deoxy-glucuronate isomerase